MDRGREKDFGKVRETSRIDHRVSTSLNELMKSKPSSQSPNLIRTVVVGLLLPGMVPNPCIHFQSLLSHPQHHQRFATGANPSQNSGDSCHLITSSDPLRARGQPSIRPGRLPSSPGTTCPGNGPGKNTSWGTEASKDTAIQMVER